MQTDLIDRFCAVVDPSNTNNVAIPRALAVAHSILNAAIAEALELYERTLRFPEPVPVIDAIERFVHELAINPEWFAELERRAELVELACGQGKLYAAARQRALASYTATPQEHCRGKLAIEQLRSDYTDGPHFLAEVIDVRRSTEKVLEEPSLGLSHNSTQAFSNWRDACRAVQHESQWLEVDGCWHLYHVYRAAEAGAVERSLAARAILQTDLGGANLDYVRAAANSIVAWVGESQVINPDQTETAKGGTGAAKRGKDEAALKKVSPCRTANLDHWGIGRDGKGDWQLFRRKRRNSDWQHCGCAEIKQGLMDDVMTLCVEHGGKADKAELLKALKMVGKTTHQTMVSRITPTLTKLRTAIKDSINRAGRFDEVGDPLPPSQPNDDSWIAAITIGYAVQVDTLPLSEGDKLTMSKKLTLRTAEQMAAAEEFDSCRYDLK